MSKALDPLRRLVVQFNARIAHFKAFPTTNIPPSAPPHLHAPAPSAAAAAVPFSKPLPHFGHFQVKVPMPSHRDGPVLLAHLNRQLNTIARNIFVPEPARVAAVDYACRAAGRPQMASLLAKGSQRMMHHQPLKFAVPHGFVRNIGLSSSRGYCSVVGSFQPAINGPVRMMAQMYAKPLGSMPTYAQKLSENDHQQKRVKAKKRQHRNKSQRSGEIKKRSVFGRLSASTIHAFLNRAALVEQQHQFLALSDANNTAVTTATAISLAKAVGKSAVELNELPKLQTSDICPTNVDMCFLLDASPLWHLDTMVSALHTDSLRAPKELNSTFIEDLLEITNAQYQHFMEVSAILQKLVQCPEVREITLEGYELRVHFAGTTLFDMTQFLRQLAVDPKSPHFDLEEVYADEEMMPEQYFPQASVNNFYAPSFSDSETWDDCSSLQSSIMMYADSERCSSVASFATFESLPVQQSPWKGVVTPQAIEDTMQEADEGSITEQQDEKMQDKDEDVDVGTTVTPIDVSNTTSLLRSEELISPWTNTAAGASMHDSAENLDKLSSKILNSTVVSEQYFDEIRGFLDTLEAVHRQSDRMFGAPSSPSASAH
ncbi:hypothetical protein BG011_000328 [Mortierella polycephala]|uniref:Uncharacterized protein n=1 Tax=Mortierella polycephala TaxID=41804 RepID=A0A9P6TUW9_9FUNG|nr:hypothetical protein BG011_000328 [Mortierella polycephala]